MTFDSKVPFSFSTYPRFFFFFFFYVSFLLYEGQGHFKTILERKHKYLKTETSNWKLTWISEWLYFYFLQFLKLSTYLQVNIKKIIDYQCRLRVLNLTRCASNYTKDTKPVVTDSLFSAYSSSVSTDRDHPDANNLQIWREKTQRKVCRYEWKSNIYDAFIHFLETTSEHL